MRYNKLTQLIVGIDCEINTIVSTTHRDGLVTERVYTFPDCQSCDLSLLMLALSIRESLVRFKTVWLCIVTAFETGRM